MGREARARRTMTTPADDAAGPPVYDGLATPSLPVYHGPGGVGTVGVLSADLSRYAAFHRCLAALEKPPQTEVCFELTGCGLVAGRSRLAHRFVGDWLWMLDDDHVFPPDTLRRLLRRLEDDRVDAVVPLCLARRPPCLPVIYSWKANDWVPIQIKPERLMGRQGLIEIGAAGAAGMLVRRRVFDRIAEPWFAVGQLNPKYLGEDLWFCRRMREAGLRLFCDLDVAIGHITQVAVWPTRDRLSYQLQWLFTGMQQDAIGEMAALAAAAEP
jgi:hypothetical protein